MRDNDDHTNPSHPADGLIGTPISAPVSLQEEAHFRVLNLLQANPHLSQRELAAALGVSLGKVNYLIKALLDKGHLKIAAFRRATDKLDKVAYLLTPEGIHNRLALTRRYLAKKTQEFDALQAEIAALQAELAEADASQPNA